MTTKEKSIKTAPVRFCTCKHVDFYHDDGRGECMGWASPFDADGRVAIISGDGIPCPCLRFEVAS